MRCLMKSWFSISMVLATLSIVALGQAVPTATDAPSVGQGNGIPWISGMLHYSLSASELVQTGFNGSGDTGASTTLSGNIGYISTHEKAPFSMIYSGGVLIGNYAGQGTTTFQNLSLSQSMV